MAATATPYRRLPGTGYRRTVPGWAMFLLFFVIGIFVLLLRGRRIQLWQGEEHLLLVEWDGNREYYKRFSYRDIQAVILRKTSDGWVMSLVLGLFAGLWALIALATLGTEPGVVWVFGILAAVFALCMGISIAAGPTCVCLLRTAVQTEELPSLGRVRRARNVLNRLRPLIAQAQGQLAPEDIPARIQEWQAGRFAAAPAGPSAADLGEAIAPPGTAP